MLKTEYVQNDGHKIACFRVTWEKTYFSLGFGDRSGWEAKKHFKFKIPRK